MCERVVEMISLTLKNIRDTCKTDSINMRAFRKDPRTVIFVPDRIKTLKTCVRKFENNKRSKRYSYWFVTPKNFKEFDGDDLSDLLTGHKLQKAQ